jgi:glutathione S-transferase
MLFLYHHHSSVCAAKVRVVLAEKGLPWKGKMLDLDAGDQFEASYLALNPKAVVPTLVHDGFVVTESNLIVEYLDDAFPAPALRPDSAAGKFRARAWMNRLDDGADGIHWATTVVTYGAAYRWRLIDKIGSDEPEALERALASAMNPASQAWTRDAVVNGTAARTFATAIRRLDALLGDFDAALAKSHWLIGDAYGLADAAYTSYIARLEFLGYDGMWRKRPHLTAWYKRLKARRSFSEVAGRYKPETLELLKSRGAKSWPSVKRLLAAGSK